MVVRGTDDYVSAVFEVLVVEKFVVRGLLMQYGPIIASGKPDAQVKLADQDVLIEARATLDSSFPRPNRAYDPKCAAARLAQDSDPMVRAAAASSLVLFDEHTARKLLTPLATDPEPAVRAAADDTLAKLEPLRKLEEELMSRQGGR